ACCKMGHIGPCRLVGKNADEEAMGLCGARMDVVVARNFLRMVAGGAAAHSDHARELVKTLLAVARGETDTFQIKDKGKLLSVAMAMEIDHPVITELRGENRTTEGDFDLMPWEIAGVSDEQIREIAEKVALTHLAQYGQQEGELVYLKRAPKGTYDRWVKHNLRPRGVDREIVEAMHRTTMGADQDAKSIMDHVLRVGLVDGWGGCLVASDIADILFGTPKPRQVKAGLAVLKNAEVNIIVHGHEPLLAGALVDTYNDPEIVAYAKSKGADGVNLAGMCCTANEILTRNGIPAAGSFLEQELAIMSGIV
ncbi:anaerobic carbon-monoxide dehydrogenase catalytic subunit, partial [Candidatus Hakubella thermalkaliphila]